MRELDVPKEVKAGRGRDTPQRQRGQVRKGLAEKLGVTFHHMETAQDVAMKTTGDFAYSVNIAHRAEALPQTERLAVV